MQLSTWPRCVLSSHILFPFLDLTVPENFNKLSIHPFIQHLYLMLCVKHCAVKFVKVIIRTHTVFLVEREKELIHPPMYF